MKKILLEKVSTPAGLMAIGSVGSRICMCDWFECRCFEVNLHRTSRLLGAEVVEGTSPQIESLKQQLREYFLGERREFDVEIEMAGTDFQRAVWSKLLDIGYGSTVAYSDVACSLGRPRAVRAVAAAIGANPMSIIVPCHRVVARSGALTGYAGGLAAKRLLLAIESSK